MIIESTAKKDKKTKNLVTRLKPGDIAILKHRDIDEVAALSIINCKPKLVINTDNSISGKYPNRGPSILQDAGIDILEILQWDVFDEIIDGERIKIVNNDVFQKGKKIATGTWLSKKLIEGKLEESKKNLKVNWIIS